MQQRFTRALTGLLIFAGISSPSFAAPPTLIGYWATGKNQAVMQIYSCGDNLLCGELVGFPMDHASDAMPTTWNHQPQCHFVFIRYLRDHGGSWKGTIINPRSGNNYGTEVRLVSPNQLRLRGYVLLQMLGATRFWTRYDGPPPPADCRMAAHSLG
jgi:uncharacterized protein (DUF2147 family)